VPVGIELATCANGSLSLYRVQMYLKPLSLFAGICLPVIVSFCQHHRIPYNFTMFPNYMGHFTQRDAQQVSTAIS
jgi:hypothetical protein